ncbi:MAG: SBBP repeat-containing protein [Saprospiraceae bacterium]|nr:SBBP repeat-containing protein [Saprospiraceae bacterium]
MKKIQIAVLFLILSQLTIAQNLGLNWVKQMGGADDDEGYSITTDANGNIYTTGYFKGTVDFVPGAGITTLTSTGNKDIFIQKLDSTGILVWVKQIGGTNDDCGNSITTDADGNVYTTGYFSGTIDFDPGAGTTNLTSVGYRDIFIQKLETTGNLLWAKQMGGTNDDMGNSITTDGNGNVYTIGSFQGITDFDPGVGTANFTSLGYDDIFIQKLDSVGNFLWAKQMGGATYDRGISITTDGDGNVYSTGFFQLTVDFDPGANIINLTSEGVYDAFIQKLDTAGNLLWVKQMGGTFLDCGTSIATDAGSNVYTTGYFHESTDFDPGAGITYLTSVGGSDIFIQKLNSAGNLLWVKQMGSTSDDIGSFITTDNGCNIYATGSFKGTVDFNPGVDTAYLTSVGNWDIYIQKLDTAGNFLWVKQMGGTSDDYSSSITKANGNIYTTGGFQLIVDFDPGTGTANLTSTGNYDIFIQKLSPCNVDVSLTTTDPTITANASGALYQWLDCNNNFTAIAGETAQSFTATANGDYAVEVTQNSCVDTSACVTISTVGVDASAPLSVHNIRVYPNPTTGKIFIEGENIETVEIINVIGQTIIQYPANKKSMLIDISSQSKGIYFVRITTNNGVVIDKVLLTK